MKPQADNEDKKSDNNVAQRHGVNSAHTTLGSSAAHKRQQKKNAEHKRKTAKNSEDIHNAPFFSNFRLNRNSYKKPKEAQMNIQTPIEAIQCQILNKQIETQSKKWDAESHLLDFERDLDILDLISDGLPDDPKTANALSRVHDNLSKIYSEFKIQFTKPNE